MSLVNKCNETLLHKIKVAEPYSTPMFISPSTGKWINVDQNNNIYALFSDDWRFIYPSSPEWQVYLSEANQNRLAAQ